MKKYIGVALSNNIYYNAFFGTLPNYQYSGFHKHHYCTWLMPHIKHNLTYVVLGISWL